MGLFDSLKKRFSSGGGDERTFLSRKVQDSPQDPQARQKLGLFLLKQGEIVEGIDQLARAAIHYEKSGFTTKAIAVLRQMLKNDPANIDFQKWIIRLLAQQGHTGDALDEIEKVAAGGIKFATEEQKIEFFRAVSESLPHLPLPSFLIVDVYLYQRKLQEAVGEMERAVRLVESSGMGKEFAGRMNVLASLAGENEELLEPCGFLWLAAGKPDDALPLLERAAEIVRSPDDGGGRSDADLVLEALREGRGGGIAGVKSFADAVRRMTEGGEGEAELPGDRTRHAQPDVTEEEKALQSAVEKLQAKVREEIGETDPEARYNLGIAYKEMGLLEEAAGEFRLSRSSPSLFLGASYLLAETLAAMEKLEDAVATLDEVIASQAVGAAEMRDVRYQKAVLLSRGGKDGEAGEIFLALFEESPDYRDVRERAERYRQ